MVNSNGDITIVGGLSGTFVDASVITRIYSNGTLDWTKEYDRGFLSSIEKIDNDFIVGGNLDSPGSSSEQLLMRISENGTIIWQKSQRYSSNSHAGKLIINEAFSRSSTN